MGYDCKVYYKKDYYMAPTQSERSGDFKLEVKKPPKQMKCRMVSK